MLTAIIFAVGAAIADAAQPRTDTAVRTAVRGYVAASSPEMDPLARIELDRYEIPGLEEKLASTAYLAKFITPEGSQFNELLFVYHNGAVVPFGSAFGGWGLMSGVMHGSCFYYSYSFGSGIHRSHVGRLALERGELKIVETAGFQNVDLFVSADAKGVSVHSGDFLSFNDWRGSQLVNDVQKLFSDRQFCGGDL